jgi:hypothetical protein
MTNTRDSAAHWIESMRSQRGVAAALIMLLALPAAIVSTALGEQASGVVIHIALGASCVVLAFAMFDFGLPRWLNLVGAISAGALGAVFLLQAVSLVVPNETLERIAFAILGQEPERFLPVGILAWFTGLLLAGGTQGWTRSVGWVVIPLVVGVEVAWLAGYFLQIEVPNPKILFLLPFAWLLMVSAKPRPDATVQLPRGAGLAQPSAS